MNYKPTGDIVVFWKLGVYSMNVCNKIPQETYMHLLQESNCANMLATKVISHWTTLHNPSTHAQTRPTGA